MLNPENETIEYKRELTDNIKREVIAFVNTSGGSIYVGVEDNGRVIGVDDPDAVMLRISSMLRDSVHPDVMMFVQILSETMEGHTVIHIQVSEGTNKPYYLKKNGLKPTGVFVRQGSASVQASAEQIRQMIKQSDGDVFEANIALNQELTFKKAEEVFAAHNLPFGAQQMQTLGIRRNDQVFTNLALLLSDQCPFTIKAAVFQGTDQDHFADRQEFGGSLFTQLEKCFDYLKLNNPTGATFSGLYRHDFKAYPDTAIREALLNCIIHRDYSFSASTLISVYRDRMEFVSIGGLLPGVHKEDILIGLSVCRNKKLADIFYRLDLIEAYGTGLMKIRSAYKSNPQKPHIQVTPNAFKIILPRMEQNGQDSSSGRNLTQEETVLSYLAEHDAITRRETEKLLGVSSSTAMRVLKMMSDQGAIQKAGNGKTTRYILP